MTHGMYIYISVSFPLILMFSVCTHRYSYQLSAALYTTKNGVGAVEDEKLEVANSQ